MAAWAQLGGFSARNDAAEVTLVVSMSCKLGWGWNVQDRLSSSRHFLPVAFQYLATESKLLYSRAAGSQKGTFQERKSQRASTSQSFCLHPAHVSWAKADHMIKSRLRERTTQGCECHEVWIIRDQQYNSLLLYFERKLLECQFYEGGYFVMSTTITLAFEQFLANNRYSININVCEINE